MTNYDVIVLGLGVMGSAIAARLSGNGHKVLGLEQFGPLHDRGASHGETRAIRKAYFEDPLYVPLMLRAYELWDELGDDLLVRSGCLIMAPGESPVMRGCLASAQQFKLPYEVYSPREIESRYGLRTQSNGFFEREGGYLKVEQSVAAFQRQALKNGAELKFNSKADLLKETQVRCGEVTYSAKQIVIAQGAWSQDLALQPKRALQFWFEAPKGENLPVFFNDTGQWIYGFPKIGETIKVAFHSPLESCHPETMNRTVSVQEHQEIAALAKPLVPFLGEFVRAKTCIYNMTPDEHFIVGEKGPKIFATGFSGHGFKFAPVIAEIVTSFVEGERPEYDLALFDPERFRS